MNNDLISVIVPVYNVSNYLRKCIDSILQQSYQNIEVILVDDGSTDASKEICDFYEKSDSRVICYHKENGGLSDARNFGIKKSHGKYLVFVDSDDYISDKMVEKLYQLIHQFHVKIGVVGFDFVYEKNKRKKEKYKKNSVYRLDKKRALEHLFSDNSKIGNYAWNKIYEKELFAKVEYPIGMNMEDLGTTYLLLDQVDFIAVNEEKLYHYFQRENSILHSVNKKLKSDKFELANKRFEYFLKHHKDYEMNYYSIIAVSLDCYPYLSQYLRQNAQKIIKNKKYKKSFWKYANLKEKIKFMIFNLDEKLFYQVFNQGKGRKENG